MSDTGNPPTPAYSARDALPLGCREFLFPGCGIATEFGYWIYWIFVGYRRYPDIGFLRAPFYSAQDLLPLCCGELAGWRAGGMRKLERMLFLRVPKGTTDLLLILELGRTHPARFVTAQVCSRCEDPDCRRMSLYQLPGTLAELRAAY